MIGIFCGPLVWWISLTEEERVEYTAEHEALRVHIPVNGSGGLDIPRESLLSEQAILCKSGEVKYD